MTRRADIQVLRAIAVLSVIIFHLKEEWLPQGYLGVDIFFVISGFVITRGIIRRSLNGTPFDARDFLMRRINRLLPALIFTLVLSVGLGFLLYAPADLKRLADSALYAMGGLSNIYFFAQTDYFSAPLDTMPLLHTWSLSAEEQFYLLFVVVSSIIAFFRGHYLLWTSITWSVLLVCSLLLYFSDLTWIARIGIVRELSLDDTAEAARFYLLPTRIYQLALGILGACVVARVGPITMKHEYRRVLWLVLTVCLIGGVVFGEEVKYINFWICILAFALVVLGEARNDLCGSPRWIWLVAIGDRSYSLYLVHWPIVVLLTFYTYAALQLPTILLATTVTAIFGEISYRRFEKGSLFNYKQLEGRITKQPSFLIYMILIFACSTFFISSNGGIESRMPLKTVPEYFVYKKHYKEILTKSDKFANVNPNWTKFRRISPKIGKIKARILVIGDSHAGVLERLARYYVSTRNHQWDVHSFSGCPPIFRHFKVFNIEKQDFKDKQKACQDQVFRWEDYIRKNADSYDWVVLASRWNWMFNYEKFNGVSIRKNALQRVGDKIDRRLAADEWQARSRVNFISGLKLTIETINQLGPQVIVVGQAPLNSRSLKTCDEVSRFLFSDEQVDKRCNFDSYADIVGWGHFVDQILRNPAASGLPNVVTLVATDVFCDHDRKICNKRIHGRRFSNDTDHYNRFGAIHLAKTWESSPAFPFK